MENKEQFDMPISLDAERYEAEFKARFNTQEPTKSRKLLKAINTNLEEKRKSVTIVVDFPVFDENGVQTTTLWQQNHPQITMDDIDEILNGESWDPDNNICTGRSYYKHTSKGKLDLTSIIVGPVLVSHERSYYDNSSKNIIDCIGPLLVDVFDVIKNDPDYDIKYRQKFLQASFNGQTVKSLNIIFSGMQASTWSKGLWAHSYNVSTLWGSSIYNPNHTFLDNSGKTQYFYSYQACPIHSISKMRNTYIHENGHMICGFPDMYPSSASNGYGLGYHCAMAYGASLDFPTQINPYLLEQIGWITPVDITDYTEAQILKLPYDEETVYKYRNKNNANEYFLINYSEKTKSGYSEGILVWRVIKNGSNSSSSQKIDLGNGEQIRNYMVQLVEPNGLYWLQNSDRVGSPMWSIYGLNDNLNDDTIPSTRWIDGSNSNLKLSHFRSTKYVVEGQQNEFGFVSFNDNGSLNQKQYEYTGEQIKPKVYIDSLNENSDYAVVYRNNIEKGQAYVEVYGINDYRGRKDISFKII